MYPAETGTNISRGVILAVEYPENTRTSDAPTASFAGLDTLYRDYSGWLKRFLRFRFRGRQDYDDIVQDTFVRVSRVPDAGTLDDPRSYLRCVATNLVRDEARRAAVRAEDASSKDEASVGDEHLESVLLKQIILSLPPIYREVFMLSRFAGMSYEEIAQHCGISVKAVEKRMTKALSMCRSQLDE